MRAEAAAKLKDYDAIMGCVEQELETLRKTGIPCRAFTENADDEPEVIQVTRQCWNHVFKHPVKRQSRVEKLERALAFSSALKLLRKTTTYQGVSVETDKGEIPTSRSRSSAASAGTGSRSSSASRRRTRTPSRCSCRGGRCLPRRASGWRRATPEVNEMVLSSTPLARA